MQHGFEKAQSYNKTVYMCIYIYTVFNIDIGKTSYIVIITWYVFIYTYVNI